MHAHNQASPVESWDTRLRRSFDPIGSIRRIAQKFREDVQHRRDLKDQIFKLPLAGAQVGLTVH
jgi:hypothetical protein